ncbi:VanZ family protein [Actinoplanes sp. NPDC051475]|uniref:VanZ family protein n=1 Tax=Actinoplanes sp. NPDC051475 TaxID=3157225 RepID=UPI0034505566
MRYQLDLALDRPGALPLLVCCALAAGVLFLPVSRLFGWRPGWTLLALLSLAPILVFTVPLEAPGWQDGAVHRAGAYVRTFLHAATFRAELHEPTSPDEQMANLLLFVPLGLFGALATRRAVWTAVAGAALSFGIEGWQAVSGVRVATAGDWVYNSGGALIGAGAGLVLLAVGAMARPRAAAPAPPPAVVPQPFVPPPFVPPPVVPPRIPAARSWSPALEPTLVLTPAVEDETTLNLTR